MENEKIEIRRVKEKEHLPLLKDLNQKLSYEMIPLLPEFLRGPSSGPIPDAYWENMLDGTGGFALISWDGERPAGMALIEYEKCAHFESLIVLPQYRRQGIGRMLVEWAKEQAAQDDYTLMTLNVLFDNKSAEALYTQAGFVGFRTTMAVEL